MIEFFLKHFYEFLFGGFFGFIALLLKKIYEIYKKKVEFEKSKYLEESNEQELIKIAMLSLLRFRINRICTSVMEVGEITFGEKADLDDLFKAYSALGGNSSTETRYKYVVEKIPLKRTSQIKL